jgi:anti-sigma factor RsiW
MTDHDGERLVAFLAGDLSSTEAEAVDAHLLECRACWLAVYEDTVGRSAAESLREVAPAEVRDRVRLVVSLARVDRSQRSSWRRATATVALVAMVTAALLSWSTLSAPHHQSAALAMIVHRVRAATAQHSIPTSITVGGRRLRVEEYDLDGGRVVVAFATQPFPMPNDAQASTGQINAPWSASVDGLTLLCVNEPRPALLVGDVTVSVERLGELAHRLAPT